MVMRKRSNMEKTIAGTQPAKQTSSGRLLSAMVGLGMICALLIALTFEGTQPRIALLRAQALEAAIFQVIPGAEQTRAYVYLPETGFRSPTEGEAATLYAGYDAAGALLGLAIPAAGQGYADVIKVLYGYHPAAEAIVGFQVLETKETPGLGDKIEKDPSFLANFSALEVKMAEAGDTLAYSIRTVKNGAKMRPWEIDGITGATISSRAIGDMLAASTREWIPLIQRHLNQFEQ